MIPMLRTVAALRVLLIVTTIRFLVRIRRPNHRVPNGSCGMAVSGGKSD
ncbi:MAG TPA: hypothetical protein VLH10_17905 [Yinghuangia sp.]|nr:hypothetical protein [Yinghuangia sp.]